MFRINPSSRFVQVKQQEYSNDMSISVHLFFSVGFHITTSNSKNTQLGFKTSMFLTLSCNVGCHRKEPSRCTQTDMSLNSCCLSRTQV